MKMADKINSRLPYTMKVINLKAQMQCGCTLTRNNLEELNF